MTEEDWLAGTTPGEWTAEPAEADAAKVNACKDNVDNIFSETGCWQGKIEYTFTHETIKDCAKTKSLKIPECKDKLCQGK